MFLVPTRSICLQNPAGCQIIRLVSNTSSWAGAVFSQIFYFGLIRTHTSSAPIQKITLAAHPSRKLHLQRSYPKNYTSSAVFHLTKKIRCFAPPNLSFGFSRFPQAQFTNQCFAPSKNIFSALVSSMLLSSKKHCFSLLFACNLLGRQSPCFLRNMSNQCM